MRCEPDWRTSTQPYRASICLSLVVFTDPVYHLDTRASSQLDEIGQQANWGVLGRHHSFAGRLDRTGSPRASRGSEPLRRRVTRGDPLSSSVHKPAGMMLSAGSTRFGLVGWHGDPPSWWWSWLASAVLYWWHSPIGRGSCRRCYQQRRRKSVRRHGECVPPLDTR